MLSKDTMTAKEKKTIRCSARFQSRVLFYRKDAGGKRGSWNLAEKEGILLVEALQGGDSTTVAYYTKRRGKSHEEKSRQSVLDVRTSTKNMPFEKNGSKREVLNKKRKLYRNRRK